MAKRRDWLEVDLDGMSSVMGRRGPGYVLLELMQNGIDAGASKVTVSLKPVPRRPIAELSVLDDGEGFHRLTDAWTLFPPSLKMGDPEKRGRFNIGEKLVLARCIEALIETVSGSVDFKATGERRQLRRCLEKGTRFTAKLKITRAEIDEALAFARMTIPPKGCAITVNGLGIKRPELTAEIKVALPTEYDDGEGRLRRTSRKTTPKLYKPRKGEEAQLYEMGLPIVELSSYRMPVHVDVLQRVPVDLERSNVPPSYLKKIFKATLEAIHADLTAESANADWVTIALSASGICARAVKSVIDLRCGEDAVAYDPSDVEGSKMAMAQGRNVIAGGTFSKEIWDNIRREGTLLLPAGKVTPSPKIFGPDGEPLKLLKTWDEGVKKVVSYATWVAVAVDVALTGVRIAVEATKPFCAAYGPDGGLILNRGRLGKAWFDDLSTNIEEVTALLLHEYAHSTVSDHLSKRFADRIAELGAKLATAVAENPEQYNSFAKDRRPGAE